MAGITLHVTLNKDNSLLALLKLPGAIHGALDEIGGLVADAANSGAPVGETGALSHSYRHVVSSNSVSIGSSESYAPYVELGTGPHYSPPPDWIKNTAPRGHHDVDPWWYIGNDGEWHQGWFVTARPHLKPAVTDNIDAFKQILRNRLENA